MSRCHALAVLTVAAAVGLATPAQAAPCASADLIPSAATGQAHSATLCLLNQERSARGLPRLRSNRLLAAAALGHGRDMVRERYFAHDSLNGRTFGARIKATGYLKRANAWVIGENLGWGAGPRSTPRQIVAVWMASAPHRRNILKKAYREIGIAINHGSPVSDHADAATYTTEFGRRG